MFQPTGQTPMGKLDKLAMARADFITDAERGAALMKKLAEKWRLEGAILHMLDYSIDDPQVWSCHHREGWLLAEADHNARKNIGGAI